MADTVQRLGVEFFGEINEASITKAIDKIQEKFAKIKLTDLAPGLSANLGSLADALGKSTASLSKLGVVAADVGSKVSQEYRGATTSVSGLTSETRNLITLTEQLATTFAKIDFTNMIKPDQMEMFRSKFVAINKQVDLFTAQLAKVAKPEFTGIQQEALAMSGQIDAAIKALSAGGIGANTPAKIQEIIGMLQQLSKMGGSALASEFKAGTDALNSFGVAADMSVQKVSKLNLGLLELQKVKSLLGEQIANVKQQFDTTGKSSEHYGASVATLNEQLIGLMKTEQSVNSILGATKKSLEDTVPVIGRLESAFNLINILDKINPPEIHKASEAWKSSAQNLGVYMKELSQLMHLKLEDADPMKDILMKSQAIEKQMATLRGLMAQDPTANKAEIDSLRQSITELVDDYTKLERGMLGKAIDKTTNSLKAFKIEVGMGYAQIRKLKPELGMLEWEKAAELLKNQVAQLYAQYQGLGPITDANREKSKQISAEWGKATKTLDAVSQKMRVLHGATADAARGLRMYWEGFAPMLKSQAAWLTGGALLFGIMYKIQDAVKNYVAFEDKLNRIRIIGEGTTKQMSQLRNSLLDLSETTGQTNVDLAEAAFYLVKYGLSVEQVNKALPSLTRLTEVAGGTIQENAKGVIALLNSYGLAYDQTDRLANALTVTLNKSALEMGDLSNILSVVASSFSQFDQPIEQVLALSAAMSNLGVVPSTIATSMRNLISVLAQVERPTERFAEGTLRKVATYLGSHKKAIEALNPAYHDMLSILGVFSKAQVTVGELYRDLNIRAAAGTAAMLNSKDSMDRLSDSIKLQMVLSSQFAETTQSASVQLKALSASLDTLVAKILGAGTGGGLSVFAQILKKILVTIGDLHTGIKGIIVRIIELGVAIAIVTKRVVILETLVASGVLSAGFASKLLASPWAKWIALIIGAIAAINLIVGALRSSSDAISENINATKESYKAKLLEIDAIHEQIGSNEKLVAANDAEKDSILIKNAALQEQLKQKRELAEEDRKTIMRQAGQMVQEATKSIQYPWWNMGAGMGEGLGSFNESSFPDLKGAELYNVIKSDSKRWGIFLEAMSNYVDSDKGINAQLDEMRGYFLSEAKGTTRGGAAEPIPPTEDYTRRKAELAAELNMIIAKNDAVRESQNIQAEIIAEQTKIDAIQEQKRNADTKKFEELDIKETEHRNKQKELSLKQVDAIKKESEAITEYETALSKLAIDEQSIILNRERTARIQAESAKISMEYRDVLTELTFNEDKLTDTRKRELKLKLEQLDNQLLEKRNELIREDFAISERAYTQRVELSNQAVAAKEQEIEQSRKLTEREKELQKLYTQKVAIQLQIADLVELITKSNITEIDTNKQEELQKGLRELVSSLGLVESKIEYVKNKQKNSWEAITEYINSAKDAAEAFSYTIGKAFTDQVEASFADFGKAMVYQNADTIKELRGQRDEDLGNIKEKYDEELLALEESLANGKVTYFDYYEQLQDLNDKYHKDVKSSQDQFEKNMKDSLVTISSLWEKFWRAMIDVAINMMAQQAVSGIFSSLRGLGGGTNVTGAGDLSGTSSLATGHSGGYIGDLVKSFHNGGLNSNEVLIKALRSEYVLNPRATNSIGVSKLDYMNKTGQVPGSEIRIYNIVDPSSIPTLSPDDVVNIISYDIAKRGQSYKTITLVR